MGVVEQSADDAVDVGLVGGLGGDGEELVLVGQLDRFQKNDDVGDGGGVLEKALGGFALDADVA